jgi:hypothetical protein
MIARVTRGFIKSASASAADGFIVAAKIPVQLNPGRSPFSSKRHTPDIPTG